MNPRLVTCCGLAAFWLCTLLPAAEPVAKPGPRPATPIPPRFKQVRDRIDALFRHRNEPPASLGPESNPFRLPGSGAPAAPTRSEGVAATAGGPELITLQQAAATLRVSGTFELNGQAHLVINARPYKAGDVIPAPVGGETVYLRVRDISRRSVTLALNEAELTLTF